MEYRWQRAASGSRWVSWAAVSRSLCWPVAEAFIAEHYWGYTARRGRSANTRSNIPLGIWSGTESYLHADVFAPLWRAVRRGPFRAARFGLHCRRLGGHGPLQVGPGLGSANQLQPDSRLSLRERRQLLICRPLALPPIGGDEFDKRFQRLETGADSRIKRELAMLVSKGRPPLPECRTGK